MTLIVDDEHLGTPESSWSGWGGLAMVAPLTLIVPPRVVIVAPHPDDEVLGVGGLAQRLASQGAVIEVITVTDGEASHPRSTTTVSQDLRAIRSNEARDALSRLGLDDTEVTRLGIPDGGIARHESMLVDALSERLRPGDLCVAPWSRDGHPDHDACGRASVRSAAAAGSSSLGCLIWAWHWARPEGGDIPWHRCRRVDLTRREAARKRWATSSFRSQMRPIGPSREDGAVLLPAMHRRYWRPFEIFIDDGRAGG